MRILFFIAYDDNDYPELTKEQIKFLLEKLKENYPKTFDILNEEEKNVSVLKNISRNP